ncbi:class I SAM-dependent methyltransferase [Ktedonosporobacter rubrisoli]|uniref:Class I SAM-dependent methyltransferase n=1 Tax=Ktedonosporobacter rubrisoli TaxID=2509675 RepID=A0A4P6JJD2_KTERU|nr:class I SAM-dependent methyltransferase [Ktedonosporobacter rubrisoli]QBD75143.1 class I SAM-dependent methyltransferase [Ktedonosporobacter rubrisoli]
MTTEQHTHSSYPLDAENAAEMARLMRQARLLSLHCGLLPAKLSLNTDAQVLDLACGPGEWLLSLAQQRPDLVLTGVDISHLMTAYGRWLAGERGLERIDFRVMNATAPLDFPDQTFDLIHARLIAFFLSPANWPSLLVECWRILRPGGHMLSLEGEGTSVTNSAAFTQLILLGQQALRIAGLSFTGAGEHMGITAMQARLFTQAGFIDLQQEAFILNWSAGTEAHQEMVQDWEVVFHLAEPFLIRQLGANAADITTLREQALEEMRDPQFCAVSYLQRLCGSKPAL